MESGQIRSKQQDIAAYSLFSAFLFIPKRHHNCPLSIRLSFESTLTNWEFVGLFGQWRAVPMRYTSLPPALVRGVVPVRLSGTGGSTHSPHGIEFRTIYRHPFVGDGFPVPRNPETCLGRDGKPVPYDAFTVGPTNSSFTISL